MLIAGIEMIILGDTATAAVAAVEEVVRTYVDAGSRKEEWGGDTRLEVKKSIST